ncbi:MAG: SGNH/GDSL hydrolase family protein [Planctomycetota bacterium]
MGDSITECCRATVEPPLGGGYVQFVHCLLTAKYPERVVEIVNRGIDGETVEDLERRWERDVINERPDHLFVMIGVNDILYRAMDPSRAVWDEAYEAAYRRVLERTRSALDCRLTLMDPTPLEEDLTAESHEHARRLCAIVRQLADEYEASHVPVFDAVFRAFEQSPDRGWMVDVPHPKLPGQAIVALEVLAHLGW